MRGCRCRDESICLPSTGSLSLRSLNTTQRRKRFILARSKGQAIRQLYMDMTYVVATSRYSRFSVTSMFRHPSAPSATLFTTRFTQIALVLTDKAAFEDMHMKGFVQKDCACWWFFGRTLGIGFYCRRPSNFSPSQHTITIQRAVERYSEIRSNYAMHSVNPSPTSKTSSDATLHEVVDCQHHWYTPRDCQI